MGSSGGGSGYFARRGRSARTRVSPCRCGIGQGFASRATGAGGGGSFVAVEWSGGPGMPDRILRVKLLQRVADRRHALYAADSGRRAHVQVHFPLEAQGAVHHGPGLLSRDAATDCLQ